MRAALVACVVLLAWCAPASAERVSDSLGSVQAELEWTPEWPSRTEPRLRITREGTTTEHAPARCATGDDPAVRFCEEPRSLLGSNPIDVVDLDGDGEPEVLVELYSGGAHCCTVSVVFRWDGTASAYEAFRRDWGNAAFRLRDLGGDGRVEFVSGDDRFAYAFGPYAASRFPVQVFAFADGTYEDVTAAYPAVLRRDARKLWRDHRRIAREGFQSKPLLAAWLADKLRLGEGDEGWRRVRAALRRGGLRPGERRFLRRVRVFLIELGYAGRADFRTV